MPDNEIIKTLHIVFHFCHGTLKKKFKFKHMYLHVYGM